MSNLCYLDSVTKARVKLRGDPSIHTHTTLRIGYISARSKDEILWALKRLKQQILW